MWGRGGPTGPGLPGHPARGWAHRPRGLPGHPAWVWARGWVTRPGVAGVPLRPPVPPQRHDCPQRGRRSGLPAAGAGTAAGSRVRRVWGGGVGRPVAAYGEEGSGRGVSARSGWRVRAGGVLWPTDSAPFRGRTPPGTAPTHPPNPRRYAHPHPTRTGAAGIPRHPPPEANAPQAPAPPPPEANAPQAPAPPPPEATAPQAPAPGTTNGRRRPRPDHGRAGSCPLMRDRFTRTD